MKEEYQYQFNEGVFREQMNLLLHLALKKNKAKAGSYLLFVGLCLTLGSLFLYFNSDGAGIVIGPLLLLTGLSYLIAYINYLVKINKIKVVFAKSINIEVERMRSSDSPVKLAISDEDFYYQDKDYEIRVKWNLIKSHLIMEGHVFLLLDLNTLSAYSISELNVGVSEFKEISTFVETKLQPHYLTPKKKQMVQNNEILDN